MIGLWFASELDRMGSPINPSDLGERFKSIFSPLGQNILLSTIGGLTLLFGLVLNYLGVKFFAGLSNGTLLTSGTVLIVVLAGELLWEGSPALTWVEKGLLPFMVWVVSALPSYLDSKLQLSTILSYLVAATLCGILVLGLWVILRRDAHLDLSREGMLAAWGIGALVVGVGTLLVVKIQTSKPVLLLVCVVTGSMQIGNGWWNLRALLERGTTMIPPEALEVQTKCLLCPWKCLAFIGEAHMTPQEVFPWAGPAFLVIPITGLVVQSLVLRRQRRQRTK